MPKIMETIKHPFFPLGATMHRLKDDTIAFVYPSENSLDSWMAWYTGVDLKQDEVSVFLDECAKGEHSTLGSGFSDTWLNIMEQLKDFSI